MADFCAQCSIDLIGFDSRDLAIGDDSRDDKDPVASPDDYYIVLCEGCWLPSYDKTIVDRDERCVAVCSSGHGSETIESVVARQAS